MACDLGVYGMAVMGLNLALNAASKGFTVCVCNRTSSRVDDAAQVAKAQGLEQRIVPKKDMKEFVGFRAAFALHMRSRLAPKKSRCQVPSRAMPTDEERECLLAEMRSMRESQNFALCVC